MINDFFEHIFCINLERRPDRMEQSKIEFEKHGLQVQFITAVDGNEIEVKPVKTVDSIATKGEIGCTLSHLKVVQLAKSMELKNCLILEDDVSFCENVNFYFHDFLSQIKPNWDMLYLGGVHHGKIENISENIIKTDNTYTTHAYAIKDTMYDAIITVLNKPNTIADIALSSLHKKNNCYAFSPNLAIQREGYSDVVEKNIAYKI